AARAARVPAEPRGAGASGRELRSGGRGARAERLQWPGEVRGLPPPGERLHGRRLRPAARAGGDRDGSGVRAAHHAEALPDDAAPWALAAPAVLPRRERADGGGGDRAL